MKSELKYNLIKYLETNNKKQIMLSILIFFILFIIVLFFCIFEIDNIERVTTKMNCNQQNCTINFYHYGISEKYEFIKLNGKKYKIIDLKFSDLELDSANNIFQEVFITIHGYSGKNNEIVEIGLCKNKEKLIKKIYKIIVER